LHRKSAAALQGKSSTRSFSDLLNKLAELLALVQRQKDTIHHTEAELIGRLTSSFSRSGGTGESELNQAHTERRSAIGLVA
jgi:hypothetical protein